MRAAVIGRDVEGGDHREVAYAAVGDDAGRAVHLCAQGQHVADGPAAALAAGLDDEHLARADRVEGALLGVVPAAVAREEVLAVRDVAERLRRADQSGVGPGRGQAVDGDVVQAALAQLGAEGGGGDARERGAQLVGQDERRFGRRRGRAPGLRALVVVDARLGAEVAERDAALRDPGDEPAAGRGSGRARRIHLHLDGVAGLRDRRTGGGAGEDDVARLQRHQLGEVGDETSEREEQVVGGALLHELAVEPGAHAQRVRVHVGRRDDVRAERREAVAALGAHVRSLVGRAEVVEAEVVRRRDAGDGGPAVLGGDPAGGAADDQRDLALEGEQLGAGGTLQLAAGRGDGGGRLEEVRGLGRGAPALGGARPVVQVHRDDLAGAGELAHGVVLLVVGDGGAGGCRCVRLRPYSRLYTIRGGRSRTSVGNGGDAGSAAAGRRGAEEIGGAGAAISSVADAARTRGQRRRCGPISARTPPEPALRADHERIPSVADVSSSREPCRRSRRPARTVRPGSRRRARAG